MSAQISMRQTVYRWLAVQTIVVFCFSLILFVFQGINSAGSALLGGLVCVLPSTLFAMRLAKHFGAHAVKRFLRDFYIGEAIKLLLTAVLILLVLGFVETHIVAFFLGFIVAEFSFWLAPWFVFKHKSPENGNQ